METAVARIASMARWAGGFGGGVGEGGSKRLISENYWWILAEDDGLTNRLVAD